MTATTRYRIPDEPRPSGLEALIVDPLWPLFAQMLVGTWFAMPWFLLNGVILGSPTLRREVLLISSCLFGSALLAFGLSSAFGTGWLDGLDHRYGMLAITALKLGCAYSLYFVQHRPFELWEHFGQKGANGIVPLVLANIILKPIMVPLIDKSLLAIVFS